MATTIADLPPGSLFITADGIYAVKSEYHYPNGQCQCILLASGEYVHFPNGDATEVAAIDLRAALQAWWDLVDSAGVKAAHRSDSDSAQ